MIVYLVELWKYGSKFASLESSDSVGVFDDEEKCLKVFEVKYRRDWEVAMVSAFNTETGEGINGSSYCLINDGGVPTKKRVAATIGLFNQNC